MTDDETTDETRADGRGLGTESTRYRYLTEHIRDAVVEFELVDDEPIVRSVNDAFVDVFGYDPGAIRGESLNDWIVPAWREEEARQLDDRTASGEVNYRQVKRETEDGLREFLYRGVPYDDETIRVSGVAIYTDLTEVTVNERRLQVMNRVLRHNLRNQAGIVAGYTTRLLDEFDEHNGERTQIAATLEKAARELQRLTREATDIEAVINGQTENAAVDCVPLVYDIVEQFRETCPAAEIRTDLPATTVVQADSRLRVAVESLLDNAVEHNPAEPVIRVSLATAESDDWVDLCVDDNAPRIPADERAVITGEAEISPTRHGSGLGLWLVKWTTEVFGGELSFSTSDLGGNRVRLRLPRASDRSVGSEHSDS
jgi:PAS domain S-box-containing protein